MASAVISLNTNNYFTEFALNPLSEKLDKNDQMIALITTIALSILTGGLFPLLALLCWKSDKTLESGTISYVHPEASDEYYHIPEARPGALEGKNRVLLEAVNESQTKPLEPLFGDVKESRRLVMEWMGRSVPTDSHIIEGIYLGDSLLVQHHLYSTNASERSPVQEAQLRERTTALAHPTLTSFESRQKTIELARDQESGWYLRPHIGGHPYKLDGEVFRPDVVISLTGEESGREDEEGNPIFQPYPTLPRNKTGIRHHYTFCLSDGDEASEQLFHKKSYGQRSVYDQVKAILDHARSEGKKVHIHCNSGRSICVGTLAKYIADSSGASFDEALHFIGTKRSIIDPTSDFFRKFAESQKKT